MDQGPNPLKLHMCWANARSRVGIGDGRDKWIIHDHLETTRFITGGLYTIYLLHTFMTHDYIIPYVFAARFTMPLTTAQKKNWALWFTAFALSCASWTFLKRFSTILRVWMPTNPLWWLIQVRPPWRDMTPKRSETDVLLRRMQSWRLHWR